MGFSMAWMALCGVPKARALELVGLRDTLVPSPSLEAAYSVGELPGGWTVVFTDLLRSSDFWLTEPERLDALSRDHAVLSCMVEDHAMVAMASYHLRSDCVWEVAYAPELPERLEVSGTPPAEFAALQARAAAEPRDGLAEYELPVDLAQAVCGFRHNRMQDVPFTVAEKA